LKDRLMTHAPTLRTLAAFAGFALSAALPAQAAEPETAPATDAPPPITVVRGGGVAEVYREEGAAFAAYGPDAAQAPVASESIESVALRALKAATDVELVALSAGAGEPADASCGSACVGGFAVGARRPVTAPDDIAQVRETGAAWVGTPGGKRSDCVATYTHAIKFNDGSHRYELLLAPGCARYRILLGGLVQAEAELAAAPSLDRIDALLHTGAVTP
jgi:hypothetical protein